MTHSHDRPMTPRSVQRTYLVLMLGNTLAASLIWGINTIFLLDAGLSNFEAFAANALFTAGMVIFEVPTGIVADTVGRRMSYLLGTLTLAGSTLLYVLLWQMTAPFRRGWWTRCGQRGSTATSRRCSAAVRSSRVWEC